jgi:hypothetical protein
MSFLIVIFCSGEMYQIQHYVTKSVSDLGQVGTPVSSTNKTDCHDITEILSKVALNIITLILIFVLLFTLLSKFNTRAQKASTLGAPVCAKRGWFWLSYFPLCLYCSQILFGFPIFGLWVYLMKVIPKTRCIVLYFTSVLFSQLQSIQPNCSSNSNSSTKVTNTKIAAHLEGKCGFIGFLCKFDMFYLHKMHIENTFIHIHTYLYV